MTMRDQPWTPVAVLTRNSLSEICSGEEQHPYSSTPAPKAPTQHPPFLRSTLAACRRGALTVPSAVIFLKAWETEKAGGRTMPKAEA